MTRFIHKTLIVILVVIGALVTVQAQSSELIIVASDSPYPTIGAALEVAQDGDTIEVHGGIYTNTPLEITKSVQLIGIDNPVIDGGGEGSIVIISADDVLFKGFTIRNTGTNNSHEDTGIVAQADRVIVEDNLLEDVLFGIYFADADHGIARNNIVLGYDRDLARRGDGMRVWFSQHILLENNYVEMSRDMLIWYADDVTIIGNTFRDSRYGLHFMYSDNAYIEGNHFSGNSVGTYLMHSTGLTVIGNDFSYNRGPSGYGIALKEMDKIIIHDNWFIGNRAGLYLDNSPSLYEGFNDIYDNVFAYNDIGVTTQPMVSRNRFTGNIFLENTQQTAVRGRGDMLANIWTVDGQGNYWSDYVGYDADEDGLGDMPYRAEKLFESMTDNNPVLRFFMYSPASQAIDLAASAFPSLRPEPRLIDDVPMTNYRFPNDSIVLETQSSETALLPALLLMLLGCLPFLALREWNFSKTSTLDSPNKGAT